MPRSDSAASVVVLVDGSNVVHGRAWSRHHGDRHEDGRGRLVDAICSWSARAGVEVVITFDGTDAGTSGVRRAAPGVEVVYTGTSDADSELERRAVRLHAAGRRHWLVSDDRAVRGVARHGADRIVDTTSFVQMLEPPAELPDPRRFDAGAGGTARIADTIDASTRSSLERLRRGDAS